MKTATESQTLRSSDRDRSGRYRKNTCECCQGPAPMQYYSETDSAGKYWNILCRKCSVRITSGA